MRVSSRRGFTPLAAGLGKQEEMLSFDRPGRLRWRRGIDHEVDVRQICGPRAA
jgi:hypothetical protein